MRDFQMLVRDERYVAPSLFVVQAVSIERARELALKTLNERPEHRGIEVWEGERLLFAIGEPLGQLRSAGEPASEGGSPQQRPPAPD